MCITHIRIRFLYRSKSYCDYVLQVDLWVIDWALTEVTDLNLIYAPGLDLYICATFSSAMLRPLRSMRVTARYGWFGSFNILGAIRATTAKHLQQL